MNDQFGGLYAGAYDALYATKDYEAECSLLELVFDRYATRPVEAVLDLGCGTGKHAVILGGRGYDVVGVDRSTSMLELARERAAEVGSAQIVLREGDVRSVRLERRFDAVLLMFAVLGYQLSDGDVRDTLRTARDHLEPGGLLVFDVWFGPAVVAEGPSDRVRTVQHGDAEIERHASGRLDAGAHLCTVEYRLVIRDASVAETSETHTVRYFFEDELHAYLDEAGMTLVRLCAFPDLDEEPGASTWNVLAVARSV